jgi:hypothetical protein
MGKVPVSTHRRTLVDPSQKIIQVALLFRSPIEDCRKTTSAQKERAPGVTTGASSPSKAWGASSEAASLTHARKMGRPKDRPKMWLLKSQLARHAGDAHDTKSRVNRARPMGRPWSRVAGLCSMATAPLRKLTWPIFFTARDFAQSRRFFWIVHARGGVDKTPPGGAPRGGGSAGAERRGCVRRAGGATSRGGARLAEHGISRLVALCQADCGARATSEFTRYVSGGSTTQNSVPLGWYLFGCLGKHTCAPPSGAVIFKITFCGTLVHSPSTSTS